MESVTRSFGPAQEIVRPVRRGMKAHRQEIIVPLQAGRNERLARLEDATLDCASKISQILDDMGRASAIAQGLNKPITSGERLRNFRAFRAKCVFIDMYDHGWTCVVFRGKGTVVGLLKVGSKNLYVYDHTGAHHEVKPLCVLDFYVHESKQRMGLGKILYEHMLKEANVLPQDLAIDKPSENFLAFLFKYYGLEHIIPQSNNYVVFDGFFADRPVMNGSSKVQRYTNCSVPVSTSNNSTRAAGY
uniref:Alpha-tubulin N-acetyltransferase n=1 Tax=Timema californicum TaxID=61474 RepID=A0A7R9J5B4_TIMCA|nr:unnamed protein product [Timema californicum]